MIPKFFDQIDIRMTNQGLAVSGISKLPPDQADQVREYIRRHRDEVIAALQDQDADQAQGIDIEAMTDCLHGQPCDALLSASGIRPRCKYGHHIFDMAVCPLGFWQFPPSEIAGPSDEVAPYGFGRPDRSP